DDLGDQVPPPFEERVVVELLPPDGQRVQLDLALQPVRWDGRRHLGPVVDRRLVLDHGVGGPVEEGHVGDGVDPSGARDADAARYFLGKRWWRSTDRGADTPGSSRSFTFTSLKSASASRRFSAAM